MRFLARFIAEIGFLARFIAEKRIIAIIAEKHIIARFIAGVLTAGMMTMIMMAFCPQGGPLLPRRIRFWYLSC